MKNTIKITSEKAIAIEASGKHVNVSLCTNGTPAIRHAVGPMTASLAGAAVAAAASTAEAMPNFSRLRARVSLDSAKALHVWPDCGMVKLAIVVWGLDVVSFEVEPATAAVIAQALTREALGALEVA